METNGELIEKKSCCICGKELPLNNTLKDANQNDFCPEDYKEYAIVEGKKENKNLLFD